MPVTQTIQSSTFTASNSQSATLTFAVPAGKYNRALNNFSVFSTHDPGSTFAVDGGKYIRTITFDYTVTSPKSSTSGSITLEVDLDVVAPGPYSPNQTTPYSFSFGDTQNGVTIPNTLVLPDDFYKDLVGGCNVMLTLSPTFCTDIYNAHLNYSLVKSVVVGGFGYLPTSADPNPFAGTPFVCTDAPSQQALHFTGAIGIEILGDRGSPVFAAYPPYTFQWSDGSGQNTAQGQASGETHAKFESQQDTPYGTDASGNLVATSVATYDVTRDDPGINQYGYGNYSSDYPWSGTVTITDSDFMPNVWVLGIGDTPARDCTMGATITVGPPSAAFAQYNKPAYTAQVTGGFVEPVYFYWATRYKNSEGNIVGGTYSFYDGSIVTNETSQTIIFASFSPPQPPYGYGLVDVACTIQDSDHFGPCSHVAFTAPVLTYTPPVSPTTHIPRRSCLSAPGSRYCRAEDSQGGGIAFHRANGPVPMLRNGSLWEASSAVTTNAKDSGPALFLDHRGLLYCAFGRVTPPTTPPAAPADTSKDGVCLKRSDDFGSTWGAHIDAAGTTEIMAIPGGTLPAAASGNGSTLIAAIVGSDQKRLPVDDGIQKCGQPDIHRPRRRRRCHADTFGSPKLRDCAVPRGRRAEPLGAVLSAQGRHGNKRTLVGGPRRVLDPHRHHRVNPEPRHTHFSQTFFSRGVHLMHISLITTPSSGPVSVIPGATYTDDSKFRLFGGLMNGAGNYPHQPQLGNGVVSNEGSSACVDFLFAGDQIDFYTHGDGGGYRVFADGVEITDGATPASTNTAPHLYSLPNDGSNPLVHIALDTPALRHIRIEGESLDIGGFAANGSYPMLFPTGLVNGSAITGPTQAIGPRMIVMGDSYTEGTGTSGTLFSWETILGRTLGIWDTWCSGQGGTGYLNSGPSGGNKVPFASRYDTDIAPNNPDIIVFAGGINDNPDINSSWTPAVLQAAATALYQHALSKNPSAKIYVLGPWQPSATHSYPPLLGVRSALMAAAAAVPEVKFLDVQPFFTGYGNTSSPHGDGNSDIYIGADGTHPNPAGHAYIASQLAPMMSELTFPAAITGVAVSPAAQSLAGGATQQFSAVVSGTASPAQTVTWTTSNGPQAPAGVTAGTITAAGLFTAPAATSATQSITVTATSTLDNTKVGTATVTVSALVVSVSGVVVSPAAPTVSGGATQQFTAVVSGTNSPSQAVTWSGLSGSITAAGLFTAPASGSLAQTITVKATSVQDSSKSGTATVTVPAVAPTHNPSFQDLEFEIGTPVASLADSAVELVAGSEGYVHIPVSARNAAGIPVDLTEAGVYPVTVCASTTPQPPPASFEAGDWLFENEVSYARLPVGPANPLAPGNYRVYVNIAGYTLIAPTLVTVVA